MFYIRFAAGRVVMRAMQYGFRSIEDYVKASTMGLNFRPQVFQQ
jgi:hypothetical protein